VAIDEAGHDDAAGGIDFEGLASLGQIFDAPGGADLNDVAVANEDRSVLNDAELT
jgi:hypothetical protein